MRRVFPLLFLVLIVTCARDAAKSPETRSGAQLSGSAASASAGSDFLIHSGDTANTLLSLRDRIDSSVSNLRILHFGRWLMNHPPDGTVYFDSGGPRKIVLRWCEPRGDQCRIDALYYEAGRPFLARAFVGAPTSPASPAPSSGAGEQYLFDGDRVVAYIPTDGAVRKAPLSGEIDSRGRSYHDEGLDAFAQVAAVRAVEATSDSLDRAVARRDTAAMATFYEPAAGELNSSGELSRLTYGVRSILEGYSADFRRREELDRAFETRVSIHSDVAIQDGPYNERWEEKREGETRSIGMHSQGSSVTVWRRAPNGAWRIWRRIMLAFEGGPNDPAEN